MRDRIEGIRHSGECIVEGERVAALNLVATLYESNGFQPIWRGSGQAGQMLDAVRSARQEGLDPADYHYEILSRILASTDDSSVDEVGLELLLSDAFFRLAYHFRFGRTEPEKLFIDWNFNQDFGETEPQKLLMQAIEEGQVTDTLNELLPHSRHYQGLRKGLAHYRDMQAAGGWPTLPDSLSLKPNMTHPHVTLLRERLQVSGDDVNKKPEQEDVYGPPLKQAVIDFQQRHEIKPDGIVGPATLVALNVPIEQRIDQIRVNMERLRWVSHSLPDDYLLVDIAGFRVMLYQDGQLAWATRAIVGRPYRKTPVFRSTMTYLVINPTWTVPPTILRDDFMPKLKQDRALLKEKNLKVIDQNGQEVDPNTLDWSEISVKNFGYKLRQPPGPNNALGRIKFMFPNHYLVYLHDTPSKSLFNKTQRAFSSGCIRIEQPLKLAEILLKANDGWTQERLQQQIATQRTRTVTLKQAIPVLMVYFTAEARNGEPVHFRTDLYGRDKKVLQALNHKLSFTPDIDNAVWEHKKNNSPYP
jgi:murein L,D-transpeptidase YcbB/YkuD